MEIDLERRRISLSMKAAAETLGIEVEVKPLEGEAAPAEDASAEEAPAEAEEAPVEEVAAEEAPAEAEADAE